VVPSKYEIKKEWLEEAINEAKKCKSEDGKIHPKVGAVIVKNGKIIVRAHRNERRDGDHAESTALKKCKDPDLKDAIMITTLEPCTSRKHKVERLPKISCADYIMHVGIKRVIIGIPDPTPEIRKIGDYKLRAQKVIVDYFPGKMANEIWKLNEDFIKKVKNK
jgi:pyrimidine deaminase RibD-like protein